MQNADHQARLFAVGFADDPEVAFAQLLKESKKYGNLRTFAQDVYTALVNSNREALADFLDSRLLEMRIDLLYRRIKKGRVRKVGTIGPLIKRISSGQKAAFIEKQRGR